MVNENFFNEQSDGTSVKIKFYKDYIEGYLFKVLMQFGGCMVADLFCGPGKNGNADGSPLILLKVAKRILENTALSKKHKLLTIVILFNDSDKQNIDKLNIELAKLTYPSNIKIIQPRSNEFSNIVSEIAKIKTSMPKFFFLDPFTYGDIQLAEIKQLMEMQFSEIMLFLPTFFAYRFITSPKNPPKLVNFLNNFTDKGVYGYSNICEFNDSIVNKVRKELKIKFVQQAMIDVGRTKNSLFLITKHIKAAMLFNNIFLKETYDGKSLNVSEIKHYEKNLSLFSKSTLLTTDTEYKNCIANFQDRMLEKLIKEKEMFNTEIIEFAVQERCKPMFAKEALLKLKKEGKIRLEYLEPTKTKGFYISEDRCEQKLCKIVYL
ncbi:MAG: hypothetical protein A2445_05005 [Candidatus Jacksonbacteria bacterium RIFOXYC2_FULL_44_29]|nr:MAG: hypothetical protein UW45_C0039G0011 [Parcubacteria group bacterium GW2011_GWC2_44_22]OGY76611.1 MAG: hypothetical protein A2240_01380 [Candidatus Jacksonbacteria bacterium RIFOXYA2_FULL_43_12]OGY77489.1 MAG: hypothetical protein A2295_00625 [Candidatus Jacksonbacteria bacterium RIFOXYB2_FULL_44_15]OGY79210.1 MAG: hypothetical protein A2550_03660 [Candidatus Jacksonbacteria bacterium RIFOXYD2_FULL_43_21]OGY80894.1 MAG: hypothetical protein A2445_05005 [Candidatus Jacksonbacteria bacteri